MKKQRRAVVEASPSQVRPGGDLTIFEVSEFVQALRRDLSNNRSITLDVAALDTIDTAGAQAILAAQRTGRVTVTGMEDALIERLLGIGWAPDRS